MDNYTYKKYVKSEFPKRTQESNKGTFGKVLNIAGSENYIGAACFSSAACLKTGAGYLTLASVDSVCKTVATMLPEAVFYSLKSTENGAISSENNISDIEKYNVLSIGCGITVNESTKDFIFSILKKASKLQKIILDADAINIIAKYKGESFLKNTIITPHPGELARLLKVDVDEINVNREKYARITSQTYECITVLKGNNTIITNGDKLFINPTGNSALAKAGSGDVLTGIIAAMAAQGLSLFNSAVTGVYLHGKAGEVASSDLTEYSVSASDIINYIPVAIKKSILSD